MNYIINNKVKKLSIVHILLLIDGCTENFSELASFF